MKLRRLPQAALQKMRDNKARELDAIRGALNCPMGRQERKIATDVLSRESAALQQIDQEIASRVKRGAKASGPIRVSDHALLHYMERQHGFDLDAMRAYILTAEVKGAIELGVTEIPFEDVMLMVTDRTITTVLRR